MSQTQGFSRDEIVPLLLGGGELAFGTPASACHHRAVRRQAGLDPEWCHWKLSAILLGLVPQDADKHTWLLPN